MDTDTPPLRLDETRARDVAASLVTPELVVVPVRHHSPACALQLLRLFEANPPSVVLVEGPRSFDQFIPFLTHPQARFPLAIYTYAVRPVGAGADPPLAGDVRSSAFYPFIDHSPELVAIRAATSAGIPVRFIDLEHAEQSAVEEAAPDEGSTLLDEQHFGHSARLRALADRLGCQDEEDLWEQLFEADVDTVDPAEHLARVTAYCLTARADRTAAQLDSDGTTAREAEMAWHVRTALAERDAGSGPVFVVVGGFHGVVLPGLVAAAPTRPRIPLGRVRTDDALVRFGFERLDRLNGYGAGMTSPAWQHRLWTAQAAGGSGAQARREAALDVLMEVATVLRDRHRMVLSTPAVAAAYEQVLRLVDLRGRPAPLRSDLLDAVLSCYVQGDADTDGVLVRSVARMVLCGTDVGQLPPGVGAPPLVADALERLRAARLSVDDTTTRTTNLDIYRSAAHRQTSRLLHGLTLLGVQFAVRTAGPDFASGAGVDRLQERWDYAWSPITEGSLVEAAIYGTTVPEAVAARFQSILAALHEGGRPVAALDAVRMVARALVLGLHDRAIDAIELSRNAIAADPSFSSVTMATAQLALLWDGREPLEAQSVADLPGLVAAAYARAIYLGRQQSEEAGGPQASVDALIRLRELLAREDDSGLPTPPYWDLVEDYWQSHPAALVRGAAAGLAYAANRIQSDELATLVAGQLSGTVAPSDAVAFARGLLATARESAWQQTDLIARLDERLRSWDHATFLAHLPDLRLAFASMTPLETDRVGAAVAALHGRADLGPLVIREVDEASAARHLTIAVAVGELLDRDGLGEWVGSR